MAHLCFPSRIISSHLLSLRFLATVVTRIQGQHSKLFAPLPTTYGSCLAFFYREKYFSPFFPRRLAFYSSIEPTVQCIPMLGALGS